jgi:thiol-disulfide isomerase/thioredoxin
MQLKFLAVIIFSGFFGDIFPQDNKVRILNFTEFEPYMHQQNDTVYIVNFWATWCGPCRRELPAMEKIHNIYSNKKVRVLLISLDFPAQIDRSLIPYLKNNNISAEVLLLDDPNSNAWINKVDTSWNGSLPATLVYKGNNNQFFEKELNYEFLTEMVSKYLNL